MLKLNGIEILEERKEGKTFQRFQLNLTKSAFSGNKFKIVLKHCLNTFDSLVWGSQAAWATDCWAAAGS